MNKITLLLLFFLGCYSLNTSAQSFEGIIEMHQVTSNGLEYDLKWYIKKGKIAYELSTLSGRSSDQMRFVPQKASHSMLMVTGNTKMEIPTNEISPSEGFSMEGAKLSTKGTSSTKDFKEIKNIEVSTPEVTSMIEVTTDVDINFAEYAEFFKSDYGLCALVESGMAGFPLSSVTKDKKGNVLTKTTFKKVTRTAVADSYFQ